MKFILVLFLIAHLYYLHLKHKRQIKDLNLEIHSINKQLESLNN